MDETAQNADAAKELVDRLTSAYEEAVANYDKACEELEAAKKNVGKNYDKEIEDLEATLPALSQKVSDLKADMDDTKKVLEQKSELLKKAQDSKTLAETDLKNLTIEYSRNQNGTTTQTAVKNDSKTDKKSSKVANTADDSSVNAYALTGTLALAGALVCALRKKREEAEANG